VRRREWAAPLGCGLLGALLFAPAVGAGRLADDFVLLRTVRSATGPLWPFSHNDLGQAAGAGHFYRPLWVLWNAFLYQLSHSPSLAHALNLVLFGIVCAEVFLLVRSVAGRRAAVFGGLLFVVFPSHGESVAWISGNTDLLAVALGLAAILIGLAPSTRSRLAGVALLAAAAMLTKEIAVVLPVLMALSAWVSSRDWRPAAAMLGSVFVVLIVHAVMVSGVGGYGPSFTVKRAGGSLVSFTVAALSAPQLALLRHPVLAVVPAGLSVLACYGIYRADERARRVALAGGAWFVVTLLPVLNEPLNLNTRNGDRLLLAPSVGLALGAGALLARVRHRSWLTVAAAAAGLAAASCIANGLDWRTAGAEARRLLADIDRLAPRGAHLVALSVPTDYRAAHLYPDALDVAVQETGRPDVTLTPCMPVHALALRGGSVSFVRTPRGVWYGRATTAAPFSVPVLGGSVEANPACAFATAPGARSPWLGSTLAAIVVPAPGPGSSIPIYFNGRDMVRAPG
jgi:hypothetical protein